jgi:hypothetical protein
MILTPKRYDNITSNCQLFNQKEQNYTLKDKDSRCVINFFVRTPKR